MLVVVARDTRSLASRSALAACSTAAIASATAIVTSSDAAPTKLPPVGDFPSRCWVAANRPLAVSRSRFAVFASAYTHAFTRVSN